MPQPVIIRKFRSACYHAREALSRWQITRKQQARGRAFNRWLEALRTRPPEVLVGGNFVGFGGCRHHMHALAKFSSLRVELAPSEKALAVIPPANFSGGFHDRFMAFKPGGIRVAHSHVFPWFVEWCHLHHSAGLRWIHTHHNWYYPEFGREKLEDWQVKFNENFLFAIKHCDVALSVSKWQQAFLRNSHGVETHYLPNGVDVGLCDAADAAQFRKNFGADDFILYAGRNDPVKNPAEFVRLAARMPQRRFLMIGQGLSPAVLESEWDVSVPPNLTVRGAATHRETLDAIAACSAIIVTSKREGLPTLVMEGMALAKPVVVPNEDGCMEAIGEGEFGLIYKLGDIDDLAAKTELALENQQIGTLARKRVLEEYDWRVVMRKLDAVYRGANAP